MDDRVEAGQVCRRDIPDVRDASGDRLRVRPEVAAAIELGVKPDDVVPGGGKERREHGADVAVVTGDQNPHLASGTPFNTGWH